MKYDIHKIMYQAISDFYLWVDQGSDYVTAYNQALYYAGLTSAKHDRFIEIIYKLTIGLRFTMSGSFKMNEDMVRDMNEVFEPYKSIISDIEVTDSLGFDSLTATVSDLKLTLSRIGKLKSP